MNNSRTKFYVINALLLVVLIGIVGISASYAFINVTTSTEGFSTPIISGNVECISLEYSESGTINLQDQYPLTEEQANEKSPVTVTVTNSCKNDVEYSLVISSLTKTDGNYMEDSKVKIKVDNSSKSIDSQILSELTSVENNSNAYTYLTKDLTERDNVKDYTHRASYYIVNNTTIKASSDGGSSTDTYNIRLWIDYNEGGVNNSTQGKTFAAALSVIVA